jgi:RHS repeat-associated protein
MITLVAATVTDPLGRTIATTKSAGLDAGAEPLAYMPDAVTGLDPATRVLTGLIADALPADQGYPYTGSAYEAAANGRPVAQGLPGSAFAIVPDVADGHVATVAYGPNPAVEGLPAGVFATVAATPPPPSAGAGAAPPADLTLSEPTLGQVGVAHVVDGAPAGATFAATLYDDRGHLAGLRPPNYFAPPEGQGGTGYAQAVASGPTETVATWTTPDTGTLHALYDLGDRPRFVQDPIGAAGGWFGYSRYDALGREVERGRCTQPWNPAVLQAHADADPGWPAAADGATVTQAFAYDEPGGGAYALGQRTTATTTQPDGEIVTESFTYGPGGVVASVAVTASAFDAATRTVTLERDAGGDVVRTTFATTGAETFGPAATTTGWDTLGRMVGAGLDGVQAPLAEFAYNADSTIRSETITGTGSAPVARTIDYLSPGWPSAVSDVAGRTEILGQELSYTSGGYQDSGYFDGSVAAMAFRYGWPGAPADLGWQYLYDDRQAFVAAKSNLGGDLDVGITTPTSYDASGNLTGGSVGADAATYNYAPGRNQVVNFTRGGRGSTFVYDGRGRAIAASGLGPGTLQVGFGYPDSGSAPTSAWWTGGALAFGYGSRPGRVTRVETGAGDAVTERRLYLRAQDGSVEAEYRQEADGTLTITQHVPGPNGVVALLVHTAGGTTTYRTLRDLEGSTRVVLDDAAAVVASYDFLPSGELARSGGPLADRFAFLFTGQELEPELGVYDYKARFYDPVVGRFLAPDPEWELASPYVYAENDPILYSDPTGGFGFLAILGFIGQAVLDVALGIVTDGAALPVEGEILAAELTADTTAEVGVATAEVGVNAARTTAQAVGSGERAVQEGEEVVADGVRAGGGARVPDITTTRNPILDEAPGPGWRQIGWHGTTSNSEAGLSMGLRLQNLLGGDSNFGGWLQYGRGFYTAESREMAETFADFAVRGGGGEARIYSVWMSEEGELSVVNVPRAWEMGGNETFESFETTQRWQNLNNYDVNRGEIQGFPRQIQNKINFRAFPRVRLVRFRPPPQNWGRPAMQILRLLFRR